MGAKNKLCMFHQPSLKSNKTSKTLNEQVLRARVASDGSSSAMRITNDTRRKIWGIDSKTRFHDDISADMEPTQNQVSTF